MFKHDFSSVPFEIHRKFIDDVIVKNKGRYSAIRDKKSNTYQIAVSAEDEKTLETITTEYEKMLATVRERASKSQTASDELLQKYIKVYPYRSPNPIEEILPKHDVWISSDPDEMEKIFSDHISEDPFVLTLPVPESKKYIECIKRTYEEAYIRVYETDNGYRRVELFNLRHDAWLALDEDGVCWNEFEDVAV